MSEKFDYSTRVYEYTMEDVMAVNEDHPKPLSEEKLFSLQSRIEDALSYFSSDIWEVVYNIIDEEVNNSEA